MPFDSDKHHRRSVRLRGYDYTQQGAYFITTVAYRRECLFGRVEGEKTVLSAYGVIVQEEWVGTPLVRPYVALDAFVVMPNHVHGILVIDDAGRGTAPPRKGITSGIVHDGRGTAPPCPYDPPTQNMPPCPYEGEFGRSVAGSLPTIVGSVKSIVTRRVNDLRGTPGAAVWQRNYYEHVIRNEDEMERVRAYIDANPSRWDLDRENPATRTGL